MTTITTRERPASFNYQRRMGAAAFLFFLVKGLLWLAAPFVFLWFA